MKAIIVLFDSELKEEIFMLMKLSDIKDYTHFLGLHGSGKQGMKRDTVTWPGSNEMIMLVLNEEKLNLFKEVVTDYKKNNKTATGLLFFYWELTEFIV